MVNLPDIPDWLAQEYPFRPKSFQTPAGAWMSYLDEGPRSEDAVLMLHGNPTWSFYYRQLVCTLMPTMRCVVPDHVGMGRSEKPSNYPYTLEQRITDVQALVDSLGLRRVHLVMHDWGGAIGCGFATRHPQKIGRLVILNTAAFTSSRIPFRIALCKLPLLGPALVRGFNGFAWPATWMAMHRRKLTDVERRGYLWPYDSWAHRVAVSAFVQDIPLDSSHPSWHTLLTIERELALFRQHPVSVLWGARDFCFDDHFLKRWQEILPHARVQRIADAGHYVIEDARDEVVPEIRRFLSPV